MEKQVRFFHEPDRLCVDLCSRTRLLSFFHASDGIAGLLGYPISSVLMEYQLWAPFSLAAVIFVMKYILLWYTPETSPYLTSQTAQAYDDINMEINDAGHPAQSPFTTPFSSALKQWCDGLISRVRTSSLWTFFSHRGLNIVFGCFIVKRIGFASESFVSQYASEILHQNLSETFWLRSLGYLGMLLVYTMFLPLFSRTIESPEKDIWVVRGSLADLMIGFCMLWLGHSLFSLCIGTLTLLLPARLTCIRFSSVWSWGGIGSRAPITRIVYRG